MNVIEVNNIVKDFKKVNKRKGIRGAMLDLIDPNLECFRAVNDISFKIKKGEMVGYLGPNGAGKSTTVKMLTGILQPTSGEILINGLSPQKKRKEVVSDIGVVFGQRSQLSWDIRLGESFELLKRIYNIDDSIYKKNLEVFNDVMNIGELVNTPVRQLSLGQRMKGDIVASMLHSPKVLFLDEPTIGLDLESKHSIRNFIKKINKQSGVTIVLTTHDLDDVEQLCNRLIVINKGKIVEDGSIDDLVEKMAPYRVLVLDLENPIKEIDHDFGEVYKHDGHKIWVRFEKSKITASELISDLSRKYEIRDLSVQEPDIEDMVREIYKN